MKYTAVRVRSRLDELTFDTFNVRASTSNGVNGIILFASAPSRPYASRGYGVTGLQETKQDGTSKIVVSGDCLYISSDCSGVKGRK